MLDWESLDAHPQLEPEFMTDLERDFDTDTWLERSAESTE